MGLAIRGPRVCAALILLAGTGYGCSITSPVSSVRMVQSAELIVRATAAEYVQQPDPLIRTTQVPDSTIRFRVIETLRGPSLPVLILPGYLSQRDDFNDHEAPYRFVRPGGRSGSCFANTYRKGAQFLLFLRAGQDMRYTVNWDALAPVNEQLHSDSDPWLLWARKNAGLKKP